VGVESLDRIYLDAQEQSIISLVKRHRYIYPGAIDVWNSLLYDRAGGA
jgi:hypothetical protein